MARSVTGYYPWASPHPTNSSKRVEPQTTSVQIQPVMIKFQWLGQKKTCGLLNKNIKDPYMVPVSPRMYVELVEGFYMFISDIIGSDYSRELDDGYDPEHLAN